MDFIKLAKERYSVRDYSSKEVEEEKINQILEAAKVAPTACNFQPQKIFVLKSPEAIEKIRKITKNAYNAPLVFLICVNEEESWQSPFVEGYNSGVMDGSIVCSHMMLEAKDLGLDSVWVVSFDPELTKKEFNIPDNLRPVCLLPVGYASENAKPSDNHNTFKKRNELVEEL